MAYVYDLSQMQLDLDKKERNLRVLSYKLISAKEKLKRVDPLSAEFDETVVLIEDIRDEMKSLAYERIKLKHKILEVPLYTPGE